MERRVNLKNFVVFFAITVSILTFQRARLAHDIAYAKDVGGAITTDTTYTLADSPINVKISFIVDEDVALTIEPGVALNFLPNTAPFLLIFFMA